MAYGRLVGSLTGSVRARGDYRGDEDGSPAYISDAFLLDQVNAGHKEAYELLADADPERLTTTALYTMASSTGSFPLPEDMYRLRAIHYQDGTSGYEPTWVRIVRDDPTPNGSVWELPYGAPVGTNQGLRRVYRLEGPMAYVTPQMPVGTVVRTTYIPAPVDLTSSLQVIDGTAGTDEYTISYALRECRIREDKDTVSADRKLAEAKVRISRMGRDRDAGQGKRLEDPLRARSAFGRLGGRGFR